MTKKNLYVVLDIETTGFEFNQGVTEITAKYFTDDNPRLENMMNELTQPSKPIPKNIVELNGISNEIAAHGAMKDYEAFARLSVLLESYFKTHNVYIIAHNAQFERNFLAWNLTQRAFKGVEFICTRNNHLYIKDGNIEDNMYTKNYSKLQQAAKHYGYEYDLAKAHRAEYDVDLTAKVFKNQLYSVDIEKMVELSA